MRYADIHTHDLTAGPDAVINLTLDDPIPASGSFSIGIHPWDSADTGDAQLALLEAKGADRRIVAIGECGLDALRGAPMARQEELFRAQVAIAERLGKPVIVHAVRTHQRIIELRKELRPTQPWIIHGYRGGPQLAEALLRAGCDISIGQRYNPAILDIVPPERLHHESDAPRRGENFYGKLK